MTKKKSFTIIKLSSKRITLLSPARTTEIKIYYSLLPVILSKCSDLQTIQMSGNIDSNKMIVPFFTYQSEVPFGLMTLCHRQRDALSNSLLVSAFKFQFRPEYLLEPCSKGGSLRLAKSY